MASGCARRGLSWTLGKMCPKERSGAGMGLPRVVVEKVLSQKILQVQYFGAQ